MTLQTSRSGRWVWVDDIPAEAVAPPIPTVPPPPPLPPTPPIPAPPMLAGEPEPVAEPEPRADAEHAIVGSTIVKPDIAASGPEPPTLRAATVGTPPNAPGVITEAELAGMSYTEINSRWDEIVANILR